MKKSQCLFGLLCWALLAQKVFAGTIVQFQLFSGVFTYLGEVDVELYDQDKPITVKNFVNLINDGYYEEGFFHRLEPGLVLQAGSFSVVNPFATNLLAPPFPLIVSEFNLGNITNEFKVGKFYSNTNWTIAMAKTSDPNSANSGFFFNLGNNSASLDNTNNSGGFTVFGHVVRGTNVLNIFNTYFYGNKLINLTSNYGASGAFTELPNALVGTNPPPYDELIYFNITTLSAQIDVTTNGAREITWPTLSGVTNILEYATNLPPVWNVLFSTNGDGNPLTVTDSSTTNARRYYRVRVAL